MTTINQLARAAMPELSGMAVTDMATTRPQPSFMLALS
jgi:hypothetical protein